MMGPLHSPPQLEGSPPFPSLIGGVPSIPLLNWRGSPPFPSSIGGVPSNPLLNWRGSPPPSIPLPYIWAVPSHECLETFLKTLFLYFIFQGKWKCEHQLVNEAKISKSQDYLTDQMYLHGGVGAFHVPRVNSRPIMGLFKTNSRLRSLYGYLFKLSVYYWNFNGLYIA